MMTPQLFINYKLRSVAHMPWRQMTYKFLNTFIDDIFAFVIKMPTLYRLGVFRDGESALSSKQLIFLTIFPRRYRFLHLPLSTLDLQGGLEKGQRVRLFCGNARREEQTQWPIACNRCSQRRSTQKRRLVCSFTLITFYSKSLFAWSVFDGLMHRMLIIQCM
jgi:hypothetical protein